MKRFTLVFSAILGTFSIALSAFGAHGLKKILDQEKLLSFEIGTRYQMYYSLILMVLGLHFDFLCCIEYFAVLFMILGVIFFSGSIYFLSMCEYWKIHPNFLRVITPVGGLLMIIGWIFLIWIFTRKIF